MGDSISAYYDELDAQEWNRKLAKIQKMNPGKLLQKLERLKSSVDWLEKRDLRLTAAEHQTLKTVLKIVGELNEGEV